MPVTLTCVAVMADSVTKVETLKRATVPQTGTEITAKPNDVSL